MLHPQVSVINHKCLQCSQISGVFLPLSDEQGSVTMLKWVKCHALAILGEIISGKRKSHWMDLEDLAEVQYIILTQFSNITVSTV